jgi:hypothetical protein
MLPDASHWLQRLCDPSDRVAAGAFSAECFPALVAWLRRRYPRVDPDLAHEAAGEALVAFLKEPGRYDAGRRSLDGYLQMAAAGDLLNLLRRERRHFPKRRIGVELDGLAGKDRRGDAPRCDDFPALAAVRDSLSERDRRVYELMRQGERARRIFADALGLTDRPAAEQRAEIKRAKDRILARFRRAAKGEAT